MQWADRPTARRGRVGASGIRQRLLACHMDERTKCSIDDFYPSEVATGHLLRRDGASSNEIGELANAQLGQLG